MIKKLFTLFALLFLLNGKAAEEKTITSLSGSTGNPIKAISTLNIEDNWYAYIQANSSTYKAQFMLGDYKTRAVLRFDDSRRIVYNRRWGLRVVFHLRTYDAAASSTNYTHQVLEVFYDPAEGIQYTDKSVLEYSNSLKADMVIDSVKFIGTAAGSSTSLTDFHSISTNTNTLPPELNEVYLDLEQITQRYHSLNTGTPQRPVIGFGTGYSSGSPLPNNELQLVWNYVPGADSYDLEWLFVDIPSLKYNAGTGTYISENMSTVSVDYDFTNATRVNLTENVYNIPMTYPSGILLYRVRYVGYITEQVSSVWQISPYTSPWSNFDYSSNGSGTYTSSGVTSTVTANDNRRYVVEGTHTDLNWQYSSGFAEEGKRKEVAGFFDGSMKSRQNVTLANTDNNAIVAETKYDYEGRAAVQIMPVPLSTQGIKYYNNFAPNFDKTDFDQSTNVTTPGTLTATGTPDQAAVYYGNNSSATGMDAYVPNASGYAYSRTRYKNDGSNMLRAQSGVGPDHRMGSGHETQYFYGSPNSQDEMDEMFGNEVGPKSHYRKNMVADPNGQISISYLDQEGRTIATCISGSQPNNLMAIDKRGDPPAAVTHDILLGNDQLNNNQEWVMQDVILVDASQTYAFEYNSGNPSYCDACLNIPDVATYCSSCNYDLEISIKDEDGNAVTLTSVSGTCSGSAVTTTPPVKKLTCTKAAGTHYEFEAYLPVGQYTITKVLKLNTSASMEAKYLYVEEQNLYHTCYHIPEIKPESCGYDCESMCGQIFTVGHDREGTPFYLDANGGFMTESQYNDSISACEARCGSTPPPVSECELRLKALKADMSPGGQYFDNTFDKYNYDVNGMLQTNTSYTTTINGWLTGQSSTRTPFPSGLTASSYTFSMTSINAILTITPDPDNVGHNYPPYSNFTDMRNDWRAGYADIMVQFHPEYQAYLALCGTGPCNDLEEGDPGYGTNTSADFDATLAMVATNTAAEAAHYFNLTREANNTTNSSSDVTIGNTDYCPTTTYSAAGSYLDPFLPCEAYCSDGGGTTANFTFISKFLKEYFQIASGQFVSIWWVMDDPRDIHSATYNSGTSMWDLSGGGSVTPAVHSYFVALHGPNGLFSQGPAAKFKFYLSAYQFYKQLLIYHKTNSLYLAPASGNPGFTASASTSVQNHYQIHMQPNSIYDAILAYNTNLCTAPNNPIMNTSDEMQPGHLGTMVSGNLSPACDDDCNSKADAWIAMIDPACANLDAGDLTDIRTALINICSQLCEHGVVSSPVTVGSFTTTCTSFSQVIQLYTPDCDSNTVKINYPPSADEPNNVQCACANLTYFISENDTIPGAMPATATATDIVNVLNGTTGGSFTTTDLGNWQTACALANANPAAHTDVDTELGASFPDIFRCPAKISYDQGVCSCTNLKNFYTAFGYNADSLNPSYGRYSTVLAIITAHINDAFYGGSLTLTSSELEDLLYACTSTSPTVSILTGNDFPPALLCDEMPADPTDEQVAALIARSQCETEALEKAMNDAAKLYLDSLDAAAERYRQAYENYCRAGASQSFTETHVNYLYLYTLYFYDQAGNLIKTVPPEGYHALDATGIAATQAHRADPVTNAFVNTAHTLVTNYKYNSLQQLIEQTTPDAGTSKFWYDALGRLAVSQNAKQAGRSTSPYLSYTSGYNAYSYTLYDELGRITEVGEIDHPSTITYDISRDLDPVTHLDAWLSNGSAVKYQITNTYYDEPMNSTVNGYFASGQENLRNRVSSVTLTDISSASTYKSASHYSYDIHGNVKTLITRNNDLPTSSYTNENKQLDYEYDLVSGNVNAVHYQSGQRDAFHHRYFYDADNRITQTQSSHDGVIWEKEAKYFYYPHGPLARTETGDRQVAGNDYVYTLQGWIKGVNNNVLNNGYDVGSDALTKDTYTGSWQYKNLNRNVAGDAMGYTLGYFTGDYVPKNTTKRPVDPVEAYHFGSSADFTSAISSGITYLANATPTTYTVTPDLYNGNISRMVTAIQDQRQSGLPVMARLFYYDQLNRLRQAKDYEAGAPFLNLSSQNSVNTTYKDNYFESFSYDFNGNINTAERWGVASGVRTQMDDLVYNYNVTGIYLDNNRLASVTEDGSLDGNFSLDIDDNSGASAYTYDENGNLKSDAAEGINDIEWNVYGKIAKITHIASTKSNLEFVYDASGNRIEKIEKTKTGITLNASNKWIYTFYQRDAQGNAMAVYKLQPNAGNTAQEMRMEEFNLYGSSRLGTYTPVLFDATTNNVDDNGDLLLASTQAANRYVRSRGGRAYEMSNHLGNVLETVADKKLLGKSNKFYAEEYFEAGQNRDYSFHQEGQSSDVIYDTYGSGLAPYGQNTFSAGIGDNAPIYVQGGDVITASIYSKNICNSCVSAGELVISVTDSHGQIVNWFPVTLSSSSSFVQTSNTVTTTTTSVNPIPATTFTLTPYPPYRVHAFAWNTQIPSVSTTYVDMLTLEITHNDTLQELDSYAADVLSATDYYAFGAPMPKRIFNSNNHRYGFNGKENDNEVVSTGQGTQDYGMRIYNPSLGKFLSVDPLSSRFAYKSPYDYAENDVIRSVDLDGGERKIVIFSPVSPNATATMQSRTMAIDLAYWAVAKAFVKINNLPDDGILHVTQNKDGIANVSYFYGGGKKTEFNANEFQDDLNAVYNLEEKQRKQGQDNLEIAQRVADAMVTTFMLSEPTFQPPGEEGLNTTSKNGYLPKIEETFQASKGLILESKLITAASSVTDFSIKESGGIIGGSFKFESGLEIELLANKTTNGETITLSDIVMYPKNASGNELKNQFGNSQIMDVLNKLKGYAKDNGFSKLGIKYERAPNSSSAKPGKIVEKVVDIK